LILLGHFDFDPAKRPLRKNFFSPTFTHAARDRARPHAPPRAFSLLFAPFRAAPQKGRSRREFHPSASPFPSSIIASSASAEARDEGLCVSLDGSADQPADKPAKERGSDLAPVLRVERGAVMAVVVTMIVVMLRLMMLRMRRRRSRCVMRYLVPGRRMHRRRMSHRVCPSWCFRRLRRMPGRSRCFCRVRHGRWSLCRLRLMRRCLHRRRSLALRRRIPPSVYAVASANIVGYVWKG